MGYCLDCDLNLLARLPDMLHETGCKVVVLMEVDDTRHDITFKRMLCTRADAQAVVDVVMSHRDAKNGVTVCRPLKRLLHIRRWRTDSRLVNDISRAMLAAGAVEVDDD